MRYIIQVTALYVIVSVCDGVAIWLIRQEISLLGYEQRVVLFAALHKYIFVVKKYAAVD